MSDFCKEKQLPYSLRPEDERLFEAAMKLGILLKAMPECTVEQANAIDLMRTFLSELPKQNPSLSAEFGFRIDPIETNRETPLERVWCISVCRSMLELFSMHSDFFATDEDTGAEYELGWLLCPGTENRNINRNADLWISQVSDPKANVGKGYKFSIEASTWQVVN